MHGNSDSPMDLFRVVLLNEFTASEKPGVIREKVATRFKLDAKVAAHIFAGRPVVIKKNIGPEAAFKLKSVLDDFGANATVENMPEIDDTDGHGYIERRIRSRREKIDRRDQQRNGQIVPDRRAVDRRN